jgi:dolichol-phosphate mannosyltransferase
VTTTGAGRRFIRFQVVGMIGAVVQIGMLALLTSRCGLEYLVSTVIAVEAAIIHNFAWHENWTWRDRVGRERSCGRRLRRFWQFNASTGLVSIGLNVLLTYAIAEFTGAPHLIANTFAIALASLFNFVAADRVVFRY